MVDFDLNEYCYGCEACANVCPNQAISFCQNSEGFHVPAIDQGKCVQCDECSEACPYLNHVYIDEKWGDTVCFAAQVKDDHILSTSSSGGLFFPLAFSVISKGGYVCGCVWDEEFRAKHIITNREVDLRKMQGSKYAQSRIGTCYSEIYELIKKGETVLFSGTPCQVGGLLSFMGKHQNLITCSVVCAGVPSPAVWDKYLEKKNKKNGPISRVNERDKRYGWREGCTSITFENGKEEVMLNYVDLYFKSLVKGLTKRKSCFNCAYKGQGHNADIIIGDFWGLGSTQAQGMNDRNGVSVCLARTIKGREIMSSSEDEIVLKPVTLSEATHVNIAIVEKSICPPTREKCLDLILQGGHDVNRILKRYLRLSNRQIILHWINHLGGYRLWRALKGYLKC